MEAGINDNLVSVFRSISQSQSTGILYVYEGENIKYLYFEGGKLIYLSFYVSKSEKIGRALIDAYKVSAENLQEAFDLAASQGVELKNVLLEKNLITPDEFKDVTRTLVEDEFCEMFQWNNSQTSFVEGDPDPQIFNKDYNTLKINIDVENLIKWIQKKVDENYTILQWIPGKANIYALIGDVYDSLDQTSLGPFDMQVAEFLDGNYSIENICYQLRQNFYKVGKSIVKLLSLGAAELISGQGPTTGISDEINKIQGGTGIAPTTPTPPADQNEAAAAAAAADTQAEGPQEPAAEPEGEPAEAPGDAEADDGPSSSARNILTYESNTKRNVLIGGAAVAAVAIIVIVIWFFTRVTPEDRFQELVKNEGRIIADEARGYDFYFNKLAEIEKSAGADVLQKVKAKVALMQTKVNDLASEDLAEAATFAESFAFDRADEVLANAEARSKKCELIETIRAKREEYAALNSGMGAKLSKSKAELATKLAQVEESPGRANLVAVCLSLFNADRDFKTFPQWKSDRATYITKLNSTVLYETEQVLEEDYGKMLSETQNLAKVEKELSGLTGDERVKPYLPKSFLADIDKKIKEIKSKAHGEYTDIEKIKDAEKFETLEKKITDFKEKYPWFAEIEKINGILDAVSMAVKKNEGAYKKAMGLYAVPNTDEYKVAVEEFQKISKRFKEYEKSVYYAEFLTTLIDTLKGWREADKRASVVENLIELAQKLRVKLDPAEREVIDFWVDFLANIDQVSLDEYNRVEKKIPEIREEADLKAVIKALEELIRKFPDSEGVKKAKAKIEEINQVVAAAKVVSGKIDALIAKEEYEPARNEKEAFLDKNPPWAGIYLKPIPIFVVPFPPNAIVKVNGIVTKIIDFKDKDEANVEVSAKGFETLRMVSAKSRDKTQELVILNRERAFKTEIKENITAGLVATANGIICTYKSGVNLYDLAGKLVWDQANLELIVGERKGIWLLPSYNADMKQIYVLGEKKMHVINATTGAKITEDNLGVNPETPLAIKTDPLIGNRFYLYFGTFSREILCLNADTLKVQWDGLKLEDVPIDVIVNPAFDNWLVVACKDEAGHMYVVDFRNGFVEKKKAMGAPVILPLIVHDKKVYAALESGVVTSLDPYSGASWQSAKLTVGANEGISDFDIIQNKLYITIRGSLASRIVILDLNKQGENVGEFKAGRPIFTDFIQACTYDGDQTLYFTTKGTPEQESGIWAWDLKEKKIKWQYFDVGLDLYPPLIIQGKVYAVSKAGALYAFQ